MLPPQELQSQETLIYKGLKRYLTDNVNKARDFVNGVRVTVEHYCSRPQSLRVVTETGTRLMAFKWNNANRVGAKAYYPIRLGYASTIMKFQGSTLDHATIWLDVA